MTTDTLGFNSAPGDVAPGSDAADKRTARLAGIFYLLVGIFGGFAEGYAEPTVYAAANAAGVVANASLVRLGVASDLLDQAFFVLLALTLYALLSDVHRSTARAMVVLVVVAAAIASLNTVFLFEALQMASNGATVTAFGAAGADAMVHMLLDMQHYGLLTAQVFFGLWLAPLGYLAIISGRFPKALGIVLIVGAACYLIDLFTAFLVPDVNKAIHTYVVIPCAVAEIWMVFYLLIIGIRPRSASAA